MNDNRDIENTNHPEIRNQGQQYQVVLPCEVKEFGNFVSGLLGKPQVLKGEVLGNFEVGYQDIANIYHLINHRVEQQNHGQLIHLSITVYYDNGTSITHNDVDRFKDYHPTDKCHPIEIALSFTYLLNFPQSNAPEKQNIEVSLSTEPNERRERIRYYPGGLFEYKIEYTDRTWATDISGLLKNHGKVLVEEHSKVKEFIRSYTDEIVEYTGILVFVAALISWLFYSFGYLDSASTSAANQIDIIILITKHLLVGVSALLILGLLILSIRRFAEYHIHVSRASYIILVEEDKKHKAKKTARERKQWISVMFAWLSNIVAGIVTNYLIISGFFVP